MTPLSKLRQLERLPDHEDALKANLLDELTALSTQPSCAYSFFISQNWESAGPGIEEPHPDSACVPAQRKYRAKASRRVILRARVLERRRQEHEAPLALPAS